MSRQEMKRRKTFTAHKHLEFAVRKFFIFWKEKKCFSCLYFLGFIALLDTWLTFLKAIAKPCRNNDWLSKLESRHGNWALDSTYWTAKSRKIVLHQNLEFSYFSPGKVHYATAITFQLGIHYWVYHFYSLRLEPVGWYNYNLKCSRNTSKLDTFLTWNPPFEWIGTKTEIFSTIFWNVKQEKSRGFAVLNLRWHVLPIGILRVHSNVIVFLHRLDVFSISIKTLSI